MKTATIASDRMTLPDPRRDHMRGSPSASIQLLEYGDFECPYSAQSAEALRELEVEMSGQISFAFRNFPLPMHPHSISAAIAAEAAGAQGKYWPMHDLLFENQDSLDDESLVRYAEILDLEVGRFVRDFSHALARERVEEDLRVGEQSQVNGTPTFFLNGELYEGELDRESLLHAIGR